MQNKTEAGIKARNSKSRTVGRWLISLCWLGMIFTASMLKAEEELEPTLTDKPMKRYYGQPAQREHWRPSEIYPEEKEEEFITQPLYEEKILVPEPSPTPRPTPVVEEKNVKRYGTSKADTTVPVMELPLPDSGEEELATEPLMAEEEVLPAYQRLPRSFRAALDRDQVHLDESFTLTVEIIVSDLKALAPFQLPDTPNLDIINTYQSDTVSTMAGQIWHVRVKRYIFLARQTGKINMPPVQVVYRGQTFQTSSRQILVEGARSGFAYLRRFSGKTAGPTNLLPVAPDVSGPSDQSEAEITAQVDHSSTYCNQAVVLTIRLKYVLDKYTRVQYQPPLLSGFLVHELPGAKVEDNIAGGRQRYIEQTYRTVLFAVAAGSASIGPARLLMNQEGHISVQATDAITIAVQPLPVDRPAPPGIVASGLVGNYQLQAHWETEKFSMQNPWQLTLTLTGPGNIRSAPDPAFHLDRSSRVYLESKKDHIQAEGEVIIGKRQYSYLLVFTRPGAIPLGWATVRYFDPALGQWQSAQAQLPTVQVVAPASFQSQPADQLNLSTWNLRPNHGVPLRLRVQRQPIIFSWGFWAWQCLGPLALLGAWGIKRQQQRALADPQALRMRRAYVNAQRWLRQVKRYIHQGEMRLFYDGLARATTEYLAAKFGQPSTYISAERLPYYCQRYQIPEKLSAHFKVALTACEYVRYAAVVLPIKDMLSLHRDLKVAIHIMEKFWQARLHRPSSPGVIPSLGLCLWLGLSMAAWSASEAELHFLRGNAQAEKGCWDKAEEEYRLCLNLKRADPDLYYNLGNVYLHQHKLGPAVLAYQRGLRLAPRDADLNYHFKLTQSLGLQKWVEKETPSTISLWLDSWYKKFTADELAWTASACYFLAVVNLILLLLWPMELKHLRGWLMVWVGLTLLLAAWSVACATESVWRKEAVVMLSQAKVYSRPYTEADTLYQLKEGTCVRIRQEEEAWLEIVFGHQRHGWIGRSAVALVE